MRLFPLAVLVIALFPASMVRADPGAGVTIETSRSLYESGEIVKATVKNTRSDAIFVAGCGALVSERLEDEDYRPTPGSACVTEGKAVKIEAGAEHVLELADSGRSGDVRRVSVAFGWGCDETRPLSQARCTDFATAVSASFRVGRRPE